MQTLYLEFDEYNPNIRDLAIAAFIQWCFYISFRIFQIKQETKELFRFDILFHDSFSFYPV